MARPKKQVPKYGTEIINGITYYRTRIVDADGKRVAIRAKTPEELTQKKEAALQEIAEARFHIENPTVKEYCEKWLNMHAAHVRETTMIDYRSKVTNHIIKPLGSRYMADITADDIDQAIIPVSKLSASVYRSVQTLYKQIFDSALRSHIIDDNPAENLNPNGGKPPKEVLPLSDEQVNTLLSAIEGLPPYPFVMIGLYAGLRREEILALQWDCVFLDAKAPHIVVKRAWHTEHNRPVILDELKTKASYRSIPIPPILTTCLNEVKSKSESAYVIPSGTDGGPLSYTQFKRLWNYIDVRSNKVRTYTRYLPNGEKVKRTVTPVIGEKAAHNNTCVYSMDFTVRPHQLRHTYITNLIHAGVDPKTVQYLAGHENIRVTMDIYAKVKYNRPEDLAETVYKAFGSSKDNAGLNEE